MPRMLTRFAAMLIAVPCFAATPESAPASWTPPGPTAVVDLAHTFDAFWLRNQALPPADMVAAFEREMAPLFPVMYGYEQAKNDVSREKYDAFVASHLARYPKIRPLFLRKAGRFEQEMPRYKASFQAMFPEFKQDVPVYFLHSLGGMSGGVREFEGRSYLIFGIDNMAILEGMDEAALFHHEFFHTYHGPRLGECGEGLIWARLWREGLAVYVAHLLNPTVDERGLTLDIPNDMAKRTRAVLKPALLDLNGVLDSTDRDAMREIFSLNNGNNTVLPSTRGYYLGYLVAQEAGKTHTPMQLARLDCKASRAVVGAAVRHLIDVSP